MVESLSPSLCSGLANVGGNTAGATPCDDPPPSTANTKSSTDAAATKKHGNCKLAWLSAVLRAPLRALRAICDSYERGMTRCAESRVAMVGGFSMGTAYPPLPRAYSSRSRSSEDDTRDLVEVSSQSVMATGVLPAAVGPDGVQRSRSAVVWRIDEDKEVDFGDGSAFMLDKREAYPRSRSYAVGRVPPAPAVAGSHYQRRVGVATA